MKLKYDITFSSSAGNSVLINNILFDIGIPHRNVHWMELMKQTHAIFISHKHTDHLNMGTFKWIEKNYPLIPIYVNDDTYTFIKQQVDLSNVTNLHIVHNRDIINIDSDKMIEIYKTKHEPTVKTMAYLGTMSDFTQFVFGTDFWDWNDLPQGKYDYLFIEANHDKDYKKYIIDLANLKHTAIPAWLFPSSDRHGTKQASFDYYLKHRINDNSHYIPLHKSDRFYNIDDLKQEVSDIIYDRNNDAEKDNYKV